MDDKQATLLKLAERIGEIRELQRSMTEHAKEVAERNRLLAQRIDELLEEVKRLDL